MCSQELGLCSNATEKKVMKSVKMMELEPAVYAKEPVITKETAPLLGKNKCTWGPSYWCSNVDNAKACNVRILSLLFFLVVGASWSLVTCHFAVRLLSLFFSIVLCWLFLHFFFLPFLDLSTDNPAIIAIIFRIILFSLSQLSLVIVHSDNMSSQFHPAFN